MKKILYILIPYVTLIVMIFTIFPWKTTHNIKMVGYCVDTDQDRYIMNLVDVEEAEMEVAFTRRNYLLWRAEDMKGSVTVTPYRVIYENFEGVMEYSTRPFDARGEDYERIEKTGLWEKGNKDVEWIRLKGWLNKKEIDLHSVLYFNSDFDMFMLKNPDYNNIYFFAEGEAELEEIMTCFEEFYEISEDCEVE